MDTGYSGRIAILITTTAIIAVGLSVVWNIAYIVSFIGVAGLVLAGHLVTADDDLPGGWSNPDGKQPFPWRELLTKAAVFVALCALAILSPYIRQLGVRP